MSACRNGIESWLRSPVSLLESAIFEANKTYISATILGRGRWGVTIVGLPETVMRSAESTLQLPVERRGGRLTGSTRRGNRGDTLNGGRVRGSTG